MKFIKLTASMFACFAVTTTHANFITATPANYTTFLSSLTAGDTLLLTTGDYINNLTLNNLNGTASQPIVITGVGNATVLQAQSCCNTVSITKCSYLVLMDLKLDGMNEFVDGVKAEGTVGNWSHHVTIENLLIENYYPDQQQVGISTKSPAWNWVIRKNKIIGAGTGMYLGNSNGDDPFVNGLIENNLIENTIGYNIEVKHQFDGVRDSFPGTQVNGYTVIRNNVFTKDTSSSTDANARPNLLVGGFPLAGWGAQDYYEIYGNFFYNNPVEALFQGTGNIVLYENVFVNQYDPSGIRAVYITPQNGVSPQDIKIFHNTVWVANSSGGIRLYNPNSSYQQYCYANAVCAALPITNFTDTLNNVTNTYNSGSNYFLSATASLSTLNLYPQNGQLTGTLTPSGLFQNNTSWDKDFNDDTFDWTFRGAYSGCCVNNGWQLQLDTMPTAHQVVSSVLFQTKNSSVTAFPNPARDNLYMQLNDVQTAQLRITNLEGKELINAKIFRGSNSINTSGLSDGIYVVTIIDADKNIRRQKLEVFK